MDYLTLGKGLLAVAFVGAAVTLSVRNSMAEHRARMYATYTPRFNPAEFDRQVVSTVLFSFFAFSCHASAKT
jgi:hypothetical protein